MIGGGLERGPGLSTAVSCVVCTWVGRTGWELFKADSGHQVTPLNNKNNNNQNSSNNVFDKNTTHLISFLYYVIVPITQTWKWRAPIGKMNE